MNVLKINGIEFNVKECGKMSRTSFIAQFGSRLENAEEVFVNIKEEARKIGKDKTSRSKPSES